jgi:catechol 2,3-dioxygenase-like lactoylglutathione lyase family enzyme
MPFSRQQPNFAQTSFGPQVLEKSMETSRLHHVSLVSAKLDLATAFYRDRLGFRPIARPPFPINGAWLAIGSLELHLIDNPAGTFRKGTSIDTNDVHFAIRVDDFDAAIKQLAARGFREDAVDGDQMRIFINRKSIAGYPQAYLLDVDRHVIEINAAQHPAI